MKHIALLACIALCGCAHFTTKQTDERSPEGVTKITTRATAYTFWESKSALANFKASQTEKTQGASVGSLNQESNAATNTGSMFRDLADFVRAIKGIPIVDGIPATTIP